MISVRVNRNSQSVRDEILTEPAMPEAKSGSGLQSPPLPPGGAAVMRGGTAATVVATVGPKGGGESGDTAPLTPPDVALHPLHSGDTKLSHKPVLFVFYSISLLPTTATFTL